MVLDSFTPELARSAGLADYRFPATNEEADIAEQVLSKELEKLSLEEHEKLLFDIHGIARTQEEDEGESLGKKLKALDDALNKMKRKKKEAYEQAKFLNRAYVESKGFRLMFLRAECFNPKAAAQTIVTHFEIKRRIFGDGEVLARDVRQDDLNEEDLAKLNDGFLQVLPERDAAGRTIICLNLGFRRQDALASPLSRASWYFMMTMMQDEEAQKMGVVYVMYNYCRFKEEIDFQREIHHLRAALPQRTHAAHYCYNDVTLRPFVAGIRLFIDPSSRFRLRPHYGTVAEIEFELQTFGIPTHVSPMQKDGSWSVNYHQEWLAMNLAKEAKDAEKIEGDETCTKETIIVPRRFDVLFGRGKIAKSHTGNLRALHLCEMNYPRYESSITGKYGKTDVAEQIVSIIHESGGRFLKPETDGWVEVDDEAAREKISHFFRHMRHKVKTILNTDTASESPLSEDSTTSSTEESITTGSPELRRVRGAKRVTPCPSPSLIAT